MNAEPGSMIHAFEDLEAHRQLPARIADLRAEHDLQALRRKTLSLEAYLRAHFEEESQEDGFFDQLRAHAPGNGGRIKDLLREHDSILAESHALIVAIDALLAQRNGLLDSILTHHDSEHQLALDTYLTDVGGDG